MRSYTLSKAPAVMLMALTLAVCIFGVHGVMQRLQPIAAIPSMYLSLAKDWQVCLLTQGQPWREEGCSWQAVSVPQPPKVAVPNDYSRRLLYKTTFAAPSQCVAEPCALLLGDLADVAVINLNGVAIAEGGLFPPGRAIGHHYPVAATLPQGLLSGEGENTLTLQVYANNLKYAGPYQGPVGVTNAKMAAAFARAHMTGTVFIPLATVLGLLLVASLLGIFSFANKGERGLAFAVCIYCIVNAAFLTSFTDVSYETLGMRWAVPMRYILRRANDTSVMAILLYAANYSGRSRKLMQGALAAVAVFFVSTAIRVSFAAVAAASPVDVVAFTQHIINASWQIKFVPPLVALAASTFNLRDPRYRQGALASIAFLLILGYDSAVFWHLPHSDFSTRFHTLGVSCIGAALVIHRATQRAVVTSMRVERDAEVGRNARQVAHDIRSPLAALEMIASRTPQLEESQRVLMRGAVDRIQDITNTLISKNVVSETVEQGKAICLLDLVAAVVSEARVARRNRMDTHIRFEASALGFGLFTQAGGRELKRAVSNIINNAAEAMQRGGDVTVSVAIGDSPSQACIQIADQGKGMSAQRVASLGQAGATFDKKGGSGLGIYHARSFLERCGGALQIDSELGRGTTVSLLLPLCPAPPWFANALTLQPGQTVAVVDDDSSVHEIWKRRLQDFPDLHLDMRHMTSHSELDDFVRAHRRENCLFLIDYELLGSQLNGLECVKSYGIENNSILVTSRAQEQEVQCACQDIGLRLLPKSMASLIPIHIQAEDMSDIEAVLVDDDFLVHATWKMAAKHCGRALAVFGTFDDFVKVATQFPKSMPIYVDFNLGEHDGAFITREIHSMGFAQVHLVTGENRDALPDMPWLASVGGKSPPSEWNDRASSAARRGLGC